MGLAVHRRGAREDHPLHVHLLGRLEQVHRPVDVDVGHLPRVLHALSHARLRGLMDHHVRAVDDLPDRLGISHVSLDKSVLRVPLVSYLAMD